MMKTKKFTILHSNDMHGDFLAEMKAGRKELMGGLSLLSGYINKVRKEEENVLYVIADAGFLRQKRGDAGGQRFNPRQRIKTG